MGDFPETVARPSAKRSRRVLRHLSRIDVLRALPPEEIQAIIPHIRRVRFAASHVLMREGEAGDAVYLIEDGRAQVTRASGKESWPVGSGTVVGEAALLTGEPRNATVTAETDLLCWRIDRKDFQLLVAESPNLKTALENLMNARRAGIQPELTSSRVWISTGLRAVEARSRNFQTWQWMMLAGGLLWIALRVNEHFSYIDISLWEKSFALLQLVTGLLIIQGACESFLHGVERLGARLHWDGFISGTVGSALSTLPEFVVIAFLVLVQPVVAFVTATVTIFNNALAFSVYSFFLPKDQQGTYAMPRSVTEAGGEILVAGGAITLIIGVVMITLRIENPNARLAGGDLVGIGIILLIIYGYYLLTLVRYYAEGHDDIDSVPPDPARLGHDTSWYGIGSMMLTGIVGSYCGGEAIGAFANIAITTLGMPMIPTAAGLAVFAGISEYIIVYKSHRRGELGIALSNVFGGMTQVMFLLLPFGLVVIGAAGLITGAPIYMVPVNAVTILLMLLLFPLFHALHQSMGQGQSLSNLDAVALTGIYVLLLYFLFTSPG